MRITYAMACSKSKKNERGIMAFKIYLAGRPPEFGDTSFTLNEFITKFLDAYITNKQKGIKNIIEAVRLIIAFERSDSFE